MYNDLIFIKDFECVGVVTSSCNTSKMCIAINDAFTFDVEELFCFDFMNEIVSKWREINALNAQEIELALKLRLQEITQEQYNAGMVVINGARVPLTHYNDLINGSVYSGSGGKDHRQQGIKMLWVYYAYAHYIKINPFDDTPNGLTHKSNEYSMPVTIGELNTLSTSYRNRAKMTYTKIKEYLCLNKENFTKFDACDCAMSCGCSGSCTCGATKKLTGFKYRSVSKK